MAYKFVNADQLDADLTTVANAIRTKGGTSESLSFPSGMTSAIAAISTGVELNFQIVGNPQPQTAKENTIWIDTNVKITSWVFSATQPTGTNGMVWIITGTSSIVEFNALKKNGIPVYPLSAKQYVSGAWVDKTAKSYQGGAWVSWWTGLLYDNGNQVTEITGGWEKNSSNKILGVANTGTVTFNSGSISLTPTGGSASSPSTVASIVSTKNKIDISGYSVLCFDVSGTGSTDNDAFGLIRSIGNDIYKNYVAKATTSTTSRTTLKVDLTNVSDGSYYVVAGVTPGAGQRYRTIYKVWLA